MKAVTKYKVLFENDDYISEKGYSLKNINTAYQTYGNLSPEKDNVILICHALTGNAHAAGIVDKNEIESNDHVPFLTKYNNMFFNKPGWWDPLIGKGRVFDTDKYFVICINIPGSCYGTSFEFSKETPPDNDYSFLTVRDVVKIQKSLLEKEGIENLYSVAGGSLGAMQVYEWASMYGDSIEKIFPIAGAVAHSPWAIALNHVQREAILNDPEWNNGKFDRQPFAGFSLARQIAMISYRSYESYNNRFSREKENDKNIYSIESYLNYQGEKLYNRFDVKSYLMLTHMMDNHDIGEKRGGIDKVLSDFKNKTVVIGINSDVLYPVEEQLKIVSKIPDAIYEEINSPHGHDAFLIEFEQLEKILRKYI